MIRWFSVALGIVLTLPLAAGPRSALRAQGVPVSPSQTPDARELIRRGEYAAAEDLALGSLLAQERQSSPDTLHLARTLDVLVEALCLGGRAAHQETEPYAQRALALKRSILTADHAEIAISLAGLASVHEHTGDYSTARSTYERAWRMWQRLGETDSSEAARCLHGLGRVCQKQGDYDLAATYLQEARSALEGRTDVDTLAWASTLHSLAVLYDVTDRPARADSLFKKSVTLIENALGRQHPVMASVLADWGIMRKGQQRLDEAEELLRESLAIRKTTLDHLHPDMAAGMGNLANVYLARGQYDLCEPLYIRAIAIVEKSLGAEHLMMADLSANLARLYHETGRYAEAEPWYERAIAILERQLGPDHVKVAAVRNNLAALCRTLGRYAQAELEYRHALWIQRKARGEEHPGVAITLNNLGVMAHDQGRFVEAESLYSQALHIWQARGDTMRSEVAECLINLAAVYRDMARFRKSEALLRRVIEPRLADPELFDPQLAAAFSNLGNLYIDQGRFREAEGLFRSALETTERVYGTEHPDVARAASALARALSLQGDGQEAERYYRQALRILEARFDLIHPDRAYVLSSLAGLFAARGDTAQALRYAEDARSTMQRAVGKGDYRMADFLESLAAIQRMRGDARAALQAAGEAVSLRRDHFHRNAASMSEPGALQMSRAWRHSVDLYLSIYTDLSTNAQIFARNTASLILSRKGEVSEAIFERKRRNMRIWADVNRRKDVAEEISRLTTTGSPGGPRHSRSVLDSLYAEDRLISERLASTYSGRAVPDLVDVDQISWRLPRNSVLLEYLKYDWTAVDELQTTPRYLAVVFASGRDPVIVDLGPAQPIDSLVGRYRTHMLHASRARREEWPFWDSLYTPLSASLYAHIWAPIAEHVPEGRLVLVAPDGSLNLVSLAGLRTPEGDYLIEHHPLHHLSSGRDLIRLDQRPGSGRGLLAVGDPDFNAAPGRGSGGATDDSMQTPAGSHTRSVRPPCGDFEHIDASPLPGTRRELQLITSDWPATSNEPLVSLLGADATEGRFKSLAPGSRIIHLATHGYFFERLCHGTFEDTLVREGSPSWIEDPLLLSGLLFAGVNTLGDSTLPPRAEDGILTALEVSEMHLEGAQMAVLSACESGLGRVEDSEGVYGLRRAFQLAGVRTVISALWPVSDQETAGMMSQLYTPTFRSIPLTMQTAQLNQIELLRARGESDHPARWAAFIATGDWK